MPCSDPTKIRKILFVTLSNLGDVVLTLPTLKSIAQGFPEAQIHVMGSAAAEAVFRGDGRIARFIPFVKKAPWRDKLALLGRIRKERYDLIVDLKRSLIGLLGGAKARNRYFGVPSKKVRHKALRHLSHLEGLCAAHPEETFLTVETSAQEAMAMRLRSLGIRDPYKKIVVAAVGSKSDLKRWPAESCAALLDRLALNDGCRVILVGDGSDVEVAERVSRAMRRRPVNLTGLTDLTGLKALLKSASLLVTNDSAPLHIADALGTPVLAIFGPTDPRKYGPRCPGSQAVRKEIFCSPCERAHCRYDHECLRDLSVAEVYRRACQILKDETARRDLKILAIRLDRMGDVVLTLPAIGAIRRRFPNAHLSVMTRPATAPILDGHPLVDEVIVYDYSKNGRHRGVAGNWRFIREMIRRRFDIVFILNPSLRSYLVSFAAQIPYRIGLDPRIPLVLTKAVADRRHEGKKHESEYTMDIVRAFGIEPDGGVSDDLWPVPSHESAEIDSILEQDGITAREPVLAVHPHASCPSKRWPPERFTRVIRMARQLWPEIRIVLIGGAEARASCRSVLAAVSQEGVTDLSGKLDLRQLGALLKRSCALLSNDSGPVHVASAVGTKTVTVYGRNQAGLSADRWKALGPGHRILQRDVGCVVCLAHACTIDFECLKAVSADDAMRALAEIVDLKKTA